MPLEGREWQAVLVQWSLAGKQQQDVQTDEAVLDSLVAGNPTRRLKCFTCTHLKRCEEHAGFQIQERLPFVLDVSFSDFLTALRRLLS